MRKNNSTKKTIKTITITAAVLLFGIGAGFAVKAAGTDNADKDAATSVVAASNMNVESVVDNETETETQAQTVEAVTEQTTEETTEEATKPEEIMAETETQKQTEEVTVATTVAETEATQPETEAKVEKPVASSDARVNEVIAGINAERTSAGVGTVTYDATLTDMAQTRASENAANNFFVVENGRHKRPDGRNASSICEDYHQYGNFGEVMGRYQATPAEIVNGWHNSATHYACMTNAKYNRVGVGVAADSNGQLYWVAILMD